MLIGPQGPPWWIFFQNFFKNVLVYPQLTQKYVLWHSKLEKSILGRKELIHIQIITSSERILTKPNHLLISCFMSYHLYLHIHMKNFILSPLTFFFLPRIIIPNSRMDSVKKEIQKINSKLHHHSQLLLGHERDKARR